MSGDERTGIGALSALAQKRYEEKIRYDALFKELGVEFSHEDILALLKDEARLKAVVSKLKLKTFW
jgi:hypothetical protein